MFGYTMRCPWQCATNSPERNNNAINEHSTMICKLGWPHALLAVMVTETEMSSFWWNFHHWLHWKLSNWQLPVQPVMKISSKWRHFRFSGGSWDHTTALVLSWCSRASCHATTMLTHVIPWPTTPASQASWSIHRVYPIDYVYGPDDVMAWNTFCITDLLWGEFTGYWWISLIKGQWCRPLTLCQPK